VVNAWRFGCGGSGAPAGRGAVVDLAVRPHGNFRPGGNVRLGIEAVRRGLLTECPPEMLDLLEVATYVYAADQAASRGRPEDLGAAWRREMRFRVPVRNPARWRSPALLGPLTESLGFLSEDDYHFEFVRRPPDPPPDYFTFGTAPLGRPVDEVLLFSGGMDSLAGAAEEAVAGHRHVVLVQQRSNPKLQPRHDRLVAALAARAARAGGLVTHVPVVVNKAEDLTADTLQRARSFLFAALSCAVGTMVGREGRVRFYENGVVGLNLPLCPAVVGARATRTTHPRTLAGFERILTAAAGRAVVVDSPYQWDTRADVVRRLAAAGCADLLAQSISCGGTRGVTVAQPHCGWCSQCVGRRFAVLAAGLEAHDPADGYRIEVLTGDRADGDRRVVLAAFLDAAQRVERVGSAAGLVARYGEAARVLRAVEGPAAATADRVFRLYRDHARDVARVLNEAAVRHIDQLRRRELPEGCTLRLVFDSGAAVRPAAQPAPAPPSPNQFVRRGLGWEVRFAGGEPRLYPGSLGFDYLRVLLGRPGDEVPAVELSAVGRPTGGAAGEVEDGLTCTAGFGADPTMDGPYARAASARLREVDELIAQLGAASAADVPDRIEQLEELTRERRQLIEQLGLAHGRNGRPRPLGGTAAERARTRVGNAIDRAVVRIAAADPALAAHLARPTLTPGKSFRYAPDPPVAWDIRD